MDVYHLLSLLFIFEAANSISGHNKDQPTALRSTTDCETRRCSHTCEKVGEFPVCLCPPHMTLGTDGKTCQETTAFLLAMFRGIRMLNEATGDERIIAPVKAASIDYHYGRKELYAYTNYTIMRFPLTQGTAAPSVSMVARTDTAVTSLAVDWVHDSIYFIAEQRSALGVTSLNGGRQQTVLVHNVTLTDGDWRDLVVDPYAKKLFWLGKEGVYSSNFQGEDLETDLIDWVRPDDITLDTTSQTIYVIGRRSDSDTKVIARARYNGTKAGEDIDIPQPAVSKVYGFGIAGDTLYWESQNDGENLYRCNLNQAETPIEVALIAELNQIVYDMKVYHRDVQKPLK